MKSYYKYYKDQREKTQNKVDSMKPIDRTDYFNRVDRIRKHYSKYILDKFALVFMLGGAFLLLFSILLGAIQTESSLILFNLFFKISSYILYIGFIFSYLTFIEYLVRSFFKDQDLNKLNEKYNL